MDPELRELHQGAREERRRALDSDPHAVPGYGRPGGIDDPVPDAEYGDDRSEPAEGYPEEAGEEHVTLPIPDGAEYDVDDLDNGTVVVQWWCPVGEHSGNVGADRDD
ncbi:hypothetical protein [Saliphagus infecundisoli]|uniref:Uncharacterized protein n=1 Tax=Saliphagus infecundisoli TaxID=1849069 RepID=A0ABD5QAS1_9EURY|nr:hypothetical protein [Saliphagus infecundisoli]